MAIHINESSEVRARYCELLLTDWSEATVRAFLDLLSVEIGPAAGTDWWGAVAPGRRDSRPANQLVLQRIGLLVSLLPEPALPPLPKVAETSDALAHTAEAAWTFLILQSLAPIEGDAGLFADTQSALFLCCADHLLSRLKVKRYRSHHDILLNAMYAHSFLVWRNRPDHMYHLQAIVFGHLGQAGERLRLLRQSLDLTPGTDHAHLTKVQMYWGELMDGGQFDEAVGLLLDEYRQAPKSDEAELKNMFVQTQRMMPRIPVRK